MRFLLTLLLLLPACRKSGTGESEAGPGPTAGTSAGTAVERRNDMVRLGGGTFRMGHDGAFQTPYGIKQFPEEAPAHTVTVSPFWIDKTEVTNASFEEFVQATGYVTFAEREFDVSSLPEEARAGFDGAPPRNGAIVFRKDAGFQGDPNTPGSALEWWRWDPTANWRQPEGAGSSIDGKDDHPVVCVTFEDAAAFAQWAGKRLPTEAEWEFAARGGLDGRIYTWGDELKPGGKWMANTWQGRFPSENTAEDGFSGLAPVRSFPPNGYGLHDMAGNVWELCSDLFDPTYFTYCEPENPKGPPVWVNRDTGARGAGPVHHVTKGGSYLCHESYCMRYRPAARHSQDSESPTNHTGFRCVKD